MVSGESERQSSPVQTPNEKGAGNGKASTERHTVTNTEKHQKTGGALSPLLEVYMLYPVAIDKGDSSFGVRVPDIPGCFSGGDDYQDAIESVREAIEAHIELLVEDGEAVPEATTVENWLSDPEYAGAVWALVDVDITRLMGKAEKINVTLPSLLIRRIDQFVAAHPEYGSRSGFLSRVAADKVIGREKR